MRITEDSYQIKQVIALEATGNYQYQILRYRHDAVSGEFVNADQKASKNKTSKQVPLLVQI